MPDYPIDDLTNTHLDAGTDDPSQARAEINASVLKTKAMLAATGTGPNEVLKLDNSGNIPAGVLANSQANLPVLSTGAANIYNVNIGLVDYNNDQVYTFLPHQDNTDQCFAEFDSKGQHEIFVKNSAGVNVVPALGMIRNRIPIRIIFTGAEFIAIDPQSSLLIPLTFDLSDTNVPVSKGQTFSVNAGTLSINSSQIYLQGALSVSSMGSLTQNQPVYLFVNGLPYDMPDSILNSTGGYGGQFTWFRTMTLPGNGSLSLECKKTYFRVNQHDSNITSINLLLSAFGGLTKFNAQWPF